MKAIVKNSPSPGIDITDIAVPEISDDELLVEVKVSGICGSDVHVYSWSGGYDWVTPYMPIIPGHEFSGVVVHTGKNIKNVKEGDRVLCRTSVTGPCGQCEACRTGRRHYCEVHRKNLTGWKKNGGFAKYYKCFEGGVIKLPDEVSFEEAAIAEPVSIGACAVDDAGLVFGDTCLITGPGTIGLVTLLMAKANGAGRCIVSGTSADAYRLEKAKELGADYTICADKEDLTEAVSRITEGKGVDVAFECSGAAMVIQDALNSVKMASGRLILEGIYSGKVELELSDAVVRASKMIKGSYSGRVAWERMLEWMAYNREKSMQCTKIITHRSRLSAAKEAFERCVRKENIKEVFVDFD
ncbi:MAG: zinc-dependent alcohol dehydrogenase [Lachnospiraceae bacterium]|jgi:L-iditol 2-dehydrogenase